MVRVGDYVLIRHESGQPMWVEVTRAMPTCMAGIVKSDPLPEGVSHGETMFFKAEDVQERVLAGDVQRRVIEDFFKIKHQPDPEYDRAWFDLERQEEAKPVMQTYITTKVVRAEPADKDGQAGYAVFYPDGYKSWCPKAEFERTARPVSDNEAALVSGIA